MTIWTPALPATSHPIADRLVHALADAIRSGALRPGTRLPTQRDLATRLRIGLGSVTAAYARAARQGLIEARVGSGSFVAGLPPAPEPAAPITLALNILPTAPAERRIAATLARLRRRPDLAESMRYPPAAGAWAERRAGAGWLARHAHLPGIDPAHLIVTAGAQLALSLALQVLCPPGQTLLTEAATFLGLRNLAAQTGTRLHGLPMDADGLCPDALERAARDGARVLYTVPTFQNPTGRVMPAARREAIAAVARRTGLWLIEDDVYGALAGPAAPPPLAATLPERTLYLAGLSKSVAPGLRIGYLLARDPALHDRLIAAIRAKTYAPPGLGGLVATQWIEDGTADEILAEIRPEIAARAALAWNRLGPHALQPGAPHCPHLWLPMSELDAERLVARAHRAGIHLTPAAASLVDPALESGVRLCLGAPPDRQTLATALDRLATILRPGAPEPGLDLI